MTERIPRKSAKIMSGFRVQLPRKFREALDWHEQDEIYFIRGENELRIRRRNPNRTDLACSGCRKELAFNEPYWTFLKNFEKMTKDGEIKVEDSQPLALYCRLKACKAKMQKIEELIEAQLE